MSISTDELRKQFRRSILYEPWRRFRAQQQLAAFNFVLDTHLSRNASESSYSEERTRTMLQARAAQRRPLLGQDGRPRIVGFGVQGWERYGLWPTFERLSDFEFFDYGAWESQRGERPNPEFRARLADDFLAAVDKLDQTRLVNACFFYADSAYIAPDLLDRLAQRGIWTIVLGLDDKHRFYERNGYGMRVGQRTLIRHADLMWTTWKTGAEVILAAGGTPWYAPPGADPAFHHPINCERDLEIVFVGQSYGTRAGLVGYLRGRGFQVDTFGSGWPAGSVSFEETVRLYNRARVVLGVGGVQSTDGIKHLKGRDFEVPMCGAVYVTTYNYELADHFRIGEEILCYGSYEECADLLHWLSSHPDVAQSIRANALLSSLERHTWEKRLYNLFAIIAGR